MATKVILIDDDELFRTGLAFLINSFLDFEVEVSEKSVFFKDLKNLKKIPGDSRLLIYSPQQDNQINWAQLLKAFNHVPMMILSNWVTKSLVLQSLENGVNAFYTKSISPSELQQIMSEIVNTELRSTIKLEPYVHKILMENDLEEIQFSTVEVQVLKRMCQLKSNAEIAAELGISLRTVESRKRNMMRKANCKNMIGVVLVFLRSQGNLRLN
jgi:DNA-binding NarL/FixJ family response regulator